MNKHSQNIIDAIKKAQDILESIENDVQELEDLCYDNFATSAGYDEALAMIHVSLSRVSGSVETGTLMQDRRD